MAMDDNKYNPWLPIHVLFTCFSLLSHLSVGFGTISANQSLSGDQTISSEHGRFILGFFNPRNTSNYYIGIWYNSVSQAVVWVANRETPVSDKYSSSLRISNGNLVLLNEKGRPVWSTNTNLISSSVQAVLLDNGNLVLRDETGSTEPPQWQSFDYPTDTWLPGSRIGFNRITKKATSLVAWKNREDPSPGLFSLEQDTSGARRFNMLLNRSQVIWSSGNWDGQMFSLIPEMALNSVYNFTYIDNENESYFSYSLYNDSIISRLLIDAGGHIQQMSWLDSQKQWLLFWSQPRQECVYCGGFGICIEHIDQGNPPTCECLSGFYPRSANEWDSEVYSSGCVRKTNLQCRNSSQTNGKTDKFLETPNVEFPANPLLVVRPVSGFRECESTCLKDCSCTAFAINKNGSCSIWHGELLSLKQLSDPTFGDTLYIRLAAAEFSSSNTKTIFIGVTIGSVVLVFLLGLVLFVVLKRRMRRNKERTSEVKYSVEDGEVKLVLFSFKSILASTNNFSEANKLGEGGFGPVYKGTLPGDVQVAVKRLSKNSGQGTEEFMNELKLIANLQHKYLVRLLGSCVEREEKILIYEYMPNRSLDRFLFDPVEKERLVWERRFKIIEGVAQGLLYIHKFSRVKVIHRDLKASNVLLDEELSPKISDFGMARIFGSHQTEANTNRVVGTYGYMSPEYAFSGQFSEKSDVFSFGVLMLEIVTGKRNTSFHRSGLSRTLLSWVWEQWKEGKEEDLIDASFKGNCSFKEAANCIRVGLLCVQEDPSDRPTMSLVIAMLTADTQTLPSPKQPAFHLHKAVDSPPRTPDECSNNELSITTPVGR